MQPSRWSGYSDRKVESVVWTAWYRSSRGKPVQLGGDKGRLAEVRALGIAAGVAVRQERAAARAADIRPIIADLRAEGVTSLAQLAAALTECGIPTSRGAERWSPMQVHAC